MGSLPSPVATRRASAIRIRQINFALVLVLAWTPPPLLPARLIKHIGATCALLNRSDLRAGPELLALESDPLQSNREGLPMKETSRGPVLTTFAVLFAVLALSNFLKPFHLDPNAGFVFLRMKTHGNANAILGPAFGALLHTTLQMLIRHY
jgi:hypothetical protein